MAVWQVVGPFDTWATHASLVHNVTDTDLWTQNGNTHSLAMATRETERERERERERGERERERERGTRILVKNHLGVVVNSFFLFLSTGRETSSVRFPLKYYSFFDCAPLEILWLLR